MNDKKIDCYKCKEKNLKENNQHLPLYLPIGWRVEDYVICNECYNKMQSE
jgi:hypothetical protein